MTPDTEQLLRAEILKKLNTLTAAQRSLFCRIYSQGILSLTVEDVVAKVPINDLEKALALINRTLERA